MQTYTLPVASALQIGGASAKATFCKIAGADILSTNHSDVDEGAAVDELKRDREAGGDGGGDVFADQTLQAERDIAPGSRAAERRSAVDEGRRAASEQRSTFQQALEDASSQRQQSQSGSRDASTAAVTASAVAETSASKTQTAGETNAVRLTAPMTTDATAVASQTQTPMEAAGVAQVANIARGIASTSSSAFSAAMASVAAAATQTATTSVASAAATTATSTATMSSVANTTPTDPKTIDGSQLTRGPRFGDIMSKAKAAKAGESQPNEESKSSANAERIVRLIRTRAGEKSSTAIMRLDPPELGKIRVQIDVQDGAATVKFEAQNRSAQRLLEKELDALRHGLEASGIRVERLEVRPPAESSLTGDDPGDPQYAEQTVGDDGYAGTDAGESSQQGSEALTELGVELREESAVEADDIVLATESLVNLVA